jgi:hypothetical protein
VADDVKPALTAEEWAKRISAGGAEMRHMEIAEFRDGTKVGFAPTHAAAAIALYDQPYGFTWADVDHLRGIVHEYEVEQGSYDALLDEIADRIAALLPPRETG